jgi:hypothetical protein
MDRTSGKRSNRDAVIELLQGLPEDVTLRDIVAAICVNLRAELGLRPRGPEEEEEEAESGVALGSHT